ncbi:WXG100 family type VII secretion target [Actinomycetospora chibensis]|uniref:WXG100 family type VII secretion target n=1 Tax=Actinomycetospora chibensis TaxID=663606 RepID=A0ABV9RPR2_9PSEU|nr:hypothetical protein [Actinomycetospora chibensis]MDD7927552.1 hypothetical protein [Actinomycetospora chibensis]
MSSRGDQAVDTVVSTVGLWWPDAEEGDLRAAADAWDRMAVALDRTAEAGRDAATGAVAGWSGDAADAFRDRWGGFERDGLAPGADGCRAIAGALRQYADEVETAKHEIEALAVEIGAGVVLGAAAAWFTFGASAAAAAGIAARLVAVAASIGVRVSSSVTGIVSTALTGATFGTVDGVAANAVGQVYRVEALDEGGYSADELGTTAMWSGAGGVLGTGAGVVATRALREAAPGPELLRGPGGGIRAALEPTDWGPLHGAWRPGLDESASRLLPKERVTARLLEDEGAMVHSRAPRSVEKYGNPDLLVRRGPHDGGTYTEVKEVSNTSNSVSRRMREALDQLDGVGGGQVVLDGRAKDLTADVAKEGWDRALRHLERSGRPIPDDVRIVLGDGTVLPFP